MTVLDTRTGKTIGHRANERFTMCSTFKLPLAAAILSGADAGLIDLKQKLTFGESDLVGHCPVTRANLGKGSMTVVALVKAAQIESDNAAANLLLRHIGGPPALTAFFRAAGDRVSRLDRYEPALNTSHRSDFRDTTTPAAMARLVGHIFAGRRLDTASRTRLINWTIATRTGEKRIRAGLPAGWGAGDKTGTWIGDKSGRPAIADKVNDVAIVWRRETPTLFVISAFYEAPMQHGVFDTQYDAVLARAGEIAAGWIRSRT